jgi:hypothetical protein
MDLIVSAERMFAITSARMLIDPLFSISANAYD